MRHLYLTRCCFRPWRIPQLDDRSQIVHFLKVQRYASRQSTPSFGANVPIGAKAKLPRNKSPAPGTSKSPDGPAKPAAPKPRLLKGKTQPPDTGKTFGASSKPADQRNRRDSRIWRFLRKFRLGKLPVAIFTILGLINYTIYTWKIDPRRSLVLTTNHFTPFLVNKKDKVSSTSTILNVISFPAGQNIDNIVDAWKTGIWSVQVIQPLMQVARSYTPLPPLDDAKPEELRLLVRQQPEGEVSTYLHKMTRSTIIELRGPHFEYEIPEDVDEVLFLAGGTGIAPALQLAYTIFNHRHSTLPDGPKLRVLWANKLREDSYQHPESPPQHSPGTVISQLQGLTSRWRGEAKAESREVQEEVPEPPLPQSTLIDEIESLKIKHAGKFSLDYFVDEDNSHITPEILQKHLEAMGQSSKQTTTEDQPKGGKKIIVVSGPEGFIRFFAGPKFLLKGREVQGPLAGVLGQLDTTGWDVWKL